MYPSVTVVLPSKSGDLEDLGPCRGSSEPQGSRVPGEEEQSLGASESKRVWNPFQKFQISQSAVEYRLQYFFQTPHGILKFSKN